MRVMVASDLRFVRTPDGNIYTQSTMHYKFLSRYLMVFDEVVVLACLKDVRNPDMSALVRANGPRVRFCPLSYYVGPWQYLRRYFQVAAAVKKAIKEADAYILRSGQIGSLLGKNLREKGVPYGVEVVADPWCVFAPGCNKSLFRPLLRVIGRLNQTRLCRYAAAVSYVTRESLQRRYPTGGWATYYSDVELEDGDVVDEAGFQERIERAKTKSESKDPWRICFVGLMAQPYKAVDVLLEAVCECIKKDLNLELILVGSGRLIPDFKKQAMDLGIADRVKFLGQLPTGGEVFKQLDQADLFILPSKTEGLPRVVVEAMARGLPCIASNVGGIPELLAVEDLVPAGDSNALEKKIQDVLSDVERLEQMARRNRQSAKGYTRSRLEKKWIEFYRKVKELTEKYQKGQAK